MNHNPSAPTLSQRLDRRKVLRLAGAGAVTAGAGALAGCGSGGGPSATAGRPPVRIGYVTPQTGPLAAFGEADNFVLTRAREYFKDGIELGSKAYPVRISVKDSQSYPDRAKQVAEDLINGAGGDPVDLMLVASTPETTNPVSAVCEAAGVPCLSTVSPWQPWFFDPNRAGDPTKPYRWTYHFFWGLEDIIQVFMDLWAQVPNNQYVGGLWPDDGDGNAWSDPELGFPPALIEQGYKVVDPGRFKNESDDFSKQIEMFKTSGPGGGPVDIVTGVPLPPDFATFWKQAGEQGFRPKIASVGKALLFPGFIEAMGNAEGASTEVWWSPTHPFKSSLTSQSCAQLAAEYTRITRRQWTQPIGFVHALFEIAVDVLRRAGGTDDKQGIVEAIKDTKLSTIVGPLDWSKAKDAGVPANVAKTPLVGGQWRRGSQWPFEVVVVSNSAHPEIPAAGTLRPIA